MKGYTISSEMIPSSGMRMIFLNLAMSLPSLMFLIDRSKTRLDVLNAPLISVIVLDLECMLNLPVFDFKKVAYPTSFLSCSSIAYLRIFSSFFLVMVP